MFYLYTGLHAFILVCWRTSLQKTTLFLLHCKFFLSTDSVSWAQTSYNILNIDSFNLTSTHQLLSLEQKPVHYTYCTHPFSHSTLDPFPMGFIATTEPEVLLTKTSATSSSIPSCYFTNFRKTDILNVNPKILYPPVIIHLYLEDNSGLSKWELDGSWVLKIHMSDFGQMFYQWQIGLKGNIITLEKRHISNF